MDIGCVLWIETCREHAQRAGWSGRLCTRDGMLPEARAKLDLEEDAPK